MRHVKTISKEATPAMAAIADKVGIGNIWPFRKEPAGNPVPHGVNPEEWI